MPDQLREAAEAAVESFEVFTSGPIVLRLPDPMRASLEQLQAALQAPQEQPCPECERPSDDCACVSDDAFPHCQECDGSGGRWGPGDKFIPCMPCGGTGKRGEGE